MFIEFEFGNFRSFRDIQKFTMEASPVRSNEKVEEPDNVVDTESFRLLRSKAIYGGNASGKSNLAKAIGAFVMMVSRSVAEEGLCREIWDDRFQLITNWDDQPVYFQYVFLMNKEIYRYGFQILQDKISYEWLYSGIKDNEIEYFLRTPDDVKIDDNFINEYGEFIKRLREGTNELFRTDSLFLTAGALNGNTLFAELRGEIRNIMTVDGVNDRAAVQYAMRHLINGAEWEKAAIKKLLAVADTGIEDIEPKEITDKDSNDVSHSQIKTINLFSFHSRYDEDGNLVDRIAVPFGEWESEGTGKLFGLGALILNALKEGRPIVIDEFDARFHPNLTLKIVQLFNSKKTNPKSAQLIFVTHDSGLLRRASLRRDQICLIDKDKYGLSSITTLIEFKGVRKDSSYEKEYLNGSYSGVPFLEEIDEVLNGKTES